MLLLLGTEKQHAETSKKQEQRRGSDGDGEFFSTARVRHARTNPNFFNNKKKKKINPSDSSSVIVVRLHFSKACRNKSPSQKLISMW